MRPAPQAPAPGHRSPLDLLAHLGQKLRVRMRIAVEDAHQALAVANQLADAALVQRRLIALHRVDLGEETCQRFGPGDVELPKWSLEQSLEVTPVEGPLDLLHELEELGRIRHRDQLSGLAHKAHVETPRMARKAVVGGMSVKRLPRAVRRVVVAEPLRRPCARHHERPHSAADRALELERDAVTEALGVIRAVTLGLERSQVEDLDVGAQDARQIPRELFTVNSGGAGAAGRDHAHASATLESLVERIVVAPTGGRTGALVSRTSRIGVRVPCNTDSATEPKIRRPTPLRPWLLMMMRLTFSTSAASTMVVAAGPYHTHAFTRPMPALRRPATTPFK